MAGRAVAEKLPLKDSRVCENGIALFNIISSHETLHKRGLIVRVSMRISMLMCLHVLHIFLNVEKVFDATN